MVQPSLSHRKFEVTRDLQLLQVGRRRVAAENGMAQQVGLVEVNVVPGLCYHMHSCVHLPPPVPHLVPAVRVDPALLAVYERDRKQLVQLLHPRQQRPLGESERAAQVAETAGPGGDVADVAVVEVGYEGVCRLLVQPPYHPLPEPPEHREAERAEHPEHRDRVCHVHENVVHGPEEGRDFPYPLRVELREAPCVDEDEARAQAGVLQREAACDVAAEGVTTEHERREFHLPPPDLQRLHKHLLDFLRTLRELGSRGQAEPRHVYRYDMIS
mmetsp:Transcript_8288/g.27895  ORF Transcript_8288/g.27895 Transcript_8288/m.27895 type:complete len:271 (-) Transcript_8288:442-1254(-)